MRTGRGRFAPELHLSEVRDLLLLTIKKITIIMEVFFLKNDDYLRLVSQEMNSEMLTCVVKVYYGVLSGSTSVRD